MNYSFSKGENRITGTDFFTFFILFLSGSFLTSNDVIPPTASKIIWFVMISAMVFRLRRQGFRIWVSPFHIVLFFVFFLSCLLHSESFSTLFFSLLSVVIAVLASNNWSFEEFKTSYVKVLFFLSVVSLVMMVLFFLLPSVMNTLFRVQNINNTAYHNNFVIFTKITNESGFGRNCGMFWEPGAFQTFISIGLLFESSKEKPSIRNIVVFAVTILTTLSTTGFFSLLFILVYMLLSDYGENGKKIKRVISIFMLIVTIFIAMNSDLFFSKANYTVFGKLLLYFRSDRYHSAISSVSIRINSVIQPIYIFIKNPILGVGNAIFRDEMYDYTLGVTSCTLVNWYAIFGVGVGIIMTLGIVNISKLVTCGKIKRFIVFLVFFITTASENYVTNVAIIIIILYGLCRNDEMKKTV